MKRNKNEIAHIRLMLWWWWFLWHCSLQQLIILQVYEVKINQWFVVLGGFDWSSVVKGDKLRIDQSRKNKIIEIPQLAVPVWDCQYTHYVRLPLLDYFLILWDTDIMTEMFKVHRKDLPFKTVSRLSSKDEKWWHCSDTTQEWIQNDDSVFCRKMSSSSIYYLFYELPFWSIIVQ